MVIVGFCPGGLAADMIPASRGYWVDSY